MSKKNNANRSMELGEIALSSSSSDISEKKNRERMKSFKGLSTKRNSVMEHLMHYRGQSNKGSQSSALFKSQRWDFKPKNEEKQTNVQTTSCKKLQDNPFLRAKQSCLNKVYTPNFNKGRECFEGCQDEFFQEEKITTFRVLKRGSLNTPITNEEIKQQ